MQERRDQKLREQRKFNKICGAVETIVEGTDVRLRGICNYRNQLCEGACGLLRHIEAIVDSLPHPIGIDDDSLISDPMVRALFCDTQTLQRLFFNNRQLQAFFESTEFADRDEVFALLFLRCREKTILGSEIHGEILMREVRQETCHFYGHRLIAPSPSEAAARIGMIITLFENVVRYIKNLMLEKKMSLSKRQHHYSPLLLEQNLNNPEVYLRILVEQLSTPERLITLQDNHVRLNDMGIKLPLHSDKPSNLLCLNQIQIGERHPNVVRLIRYPKSGLSERFVSEPSLLMVDGLNRSSCPYPM
ncbi:MAG: hypothetical protein PVG22_02520 [Chromatiales bacterium]